MKDKWTYVSAFSYADKHFSVWIKPILQENGVYRIDTKSEETTLAQSKKDLEEHGIKYLTS